MQSIKKLTKHPVIARYGANTIWLVAEKLVAMLVGLFIGAWVARYLGPENFGILGYVTALTILFNPILSLGLSGIVSRELVQKPKIVKSILSTAALMRIASAVVYIVFTTLLLLTIEQEVLYAELAFCLCLALSIASVSEVFLLFFRSKVQARYGVVSQVVGQLTGGLAKIFFILLGSGVLWFAVSNLIGALVAAAVLAGTYYMRQKSFIGVSWYDFSYAKSLIKESWPVMFSAAFVVVYLHIDKIMLKHMLGPSEVGFYAAATKITSIFFFLPVVFGWSLQPAIVRAHDKSREEYVNLLKHMMAGLAILGYLIAGCLVIASDNLVWLLFGDEYAYSAELLKVHAIAIIFVFLSQPRGLWVSTESHHKFAMWSNIAAGIINVTLNFYWIESYGSIGAAWATIVSYFVAFVGGGLLYRSAWWVTGEQIRSMFLLNAGSLYRAFKAL